MAVDCSGHGRKNGTVCQCDAPAPGLGQMGYVGEDCEISKHQLPFESFSHHPQLKLGIFKCPLKEATTSI